MEDVIRRARRALERLRRRWDRTDEPDDEDLNDETDMILGRTDAIVGKLRQVRGADDNEESENVDDDRDMF